MGAVMSPVFKAMEKATGGGSSGSAAPSVTAPPATAPAATAPAATAPAATAPAATAPAATPSAEGGARVRATRSSTMLAGRREDDDSRANVRVGTAKLLGG